MRLLEDSRLDVDKLSGGRTTQLVRSQLWASATGIDVGAVPENEVLSDQWMAGLTMDPVWLEPGSVPMFVLHGEDDAIVLVKEVRTLFKGLPRPNRRLH